MLQSFLPGIRHLRAPLVAGYLWLLGLWMLLHDSMARGGPATIHRDLVDLANWAGKPATLTALTVLAYLVGTLSIATTQGFSKIAGLASGRWLEWLMPRYWIDKRIEGALRDSIDRRLSDYYVDSKEFRGYLTEQLTSYRNRAANSGRFLYPLARRLPVRSSLEREALQDDYVRWRLIHALVNKEQYVEAAKDDVGRLEYRLLGKEDQVYAEYDRLKSEGVFRLSLVLPLVFLCVATSYVESRWWLAGLALPVTFVYLSGGSFAEAYYGLAAAVSSGRVELPSLDRIQTTDIVLEPYEVVVVDENPDLPSPYLQAQRWYSRFRR